MSTSPRTPTAALPARSSPPLRELTARQLQWIAGGFVLTFSTMPGQTIFIAQFNAALRSEFALSHGAFGVLYTIATLASSICLIWAGALADRFAPRPLGIACLVGLAAVAVAMSAVNSVVLLGLALFGLRFFGQGMLGHIAMTTMARWFNRFRGRALSFAGFGFTTGEAAIPFSITLAIAAFGWRSVWLGAAAVLMIVMAPVVAMLFANPPDGKRALARGEVNPDGAVAGAATGAQWTRGAVFRDPLFFSIIPGVMGIPAIGTLFIFHQAQLVSVKGWDLTVFTALFPVLAVTIVATSFVAGFLVDRFGAWRLMPLTLIPEGIGCVMLGLVDQTWLIPLFFISFGMSGGTMAPVLGALWAELYGTAHIGSIRALATSAMVFASAIGPGVAGVLIDAGVGLETQAFFYAAYCFSGALLYLALRTRFATRVAALA